MSEINGRFIYWLPAILYMFLIFFLSTNPAPESAKVIPLVGPFKIVHFVEYGILSLLYFFGLHNTTDMPLLKKFIYSIVFTYLYGVTDEIHQSFNPARTASVADTFTNFLGALGMQAGIFGIVRAKNILNNKILNPKF